MRSIFFLFLTIILCGCATTFKGYKSSVDLENIPDNTQIFTKDGVHIPILTKYERVGKRDSVTLEMKYRDSTATNKRYIQLRSKNEYVLVIRNGGSESII